MSAAPPTAGEHAPPDPVRGAPGAWSSVAGLAWMAGASALFAVMSVTTRLASRELPWAEVALARAGVGLLVALIVARTRGASLAIVDRRRAWLRSLCGTGAMVCTFFTLGAPTIALGDAVTLGSTTGVFIAILSPRLLGEPSSRRIWVAIALAFSGVALVAGPRFHISGHLALVATLGALLSSLAMIMLRKLGAARHATGDTPEAIVVHFSAVSTVALLFFAVPSLRVPTSHGLLWLVLTGLTAGLAQLAMTRAYALEHAAKLGAVGYLGVVMSHLLGVVALGERPGADQLAGTTLVVGAGVLLGWLELRDRARARA